MPQPYPRYFEFHDAVWRDHSPPASLHCWLRAQPPGQWQPSTLARVEPMTRAENNRVQALIWQVSEAHLADYVQAENWQKRGVRSLSELLPPSSRAILDAALKEKSMARSGSLLILKAITSQDPIESRNKQALRNLAFSKVVPEKS